MKSASPPTPPPPRMVRAPICPVGVFTSITDSETEQAELGTCVGRLDRLWHEGGSTGSSCSCGTARSCAICTFSTLPM
eukprot:6524811-Pyramimonas_sp.AAC.1